MLTSTQIVQWGDRMKQAARDREREGGGAIVAVNVKREQHKPAHRPHYTTAETRCRFTGNRVSYTCGADQ
jgi:hypothetical protein